MLEGWNKVSVYEWVPHSLDVANCYSQLSAGVGNVGEGGCIGSLGGLDGSISCIYTMLAIWWLVWQVHFP